MTCVTVIFYCYWACLNVNPHELFLITQYILFLYATNFVAHIYYSISDVNIFTITFQENILFGFISKEKYF